MIVEVKRGREPTGRAALGIRSVIVGSISLYNGKSLVFIPRKYRGNIYNLKQSHKMAKV